MGETGEREGGNTLHAAHEHTVADSGESQVEGPAFTKVSNHHMTASEICDSVIEVDDQEGWKEREKREGR